MAGIVGTITKLGEYLSPKDISLKVFGNNGQETKVELFSDRIFCIPAFQRELRWNADNVNTLLADASRGPSFLGNIIISTNASHHCDIIDGQQRTTVCILIIEYLRQKFQSRIEIPDLCPIDNKSFTGLHEMIEYGFEKGSMSDDEWNRLVKTDLYAQLNSYRAIWNVIQASDLLNKVSSAKTVLQNLIASEVNIVVSYSDTIGSIRFFLDVNLKGVQLDTEDIFKGYLLGQDSRDEVCEWWQKNKAASIRFNHVKGRENEKLFPLMKLYEYYLHCNLFTSEWGRENGTELKFGENFRLSEPVTIEGQRFFKGTHVIEVINDRQYLLNVLKNVNRCLNVMVDIVETTGPSDSFARLFKCTQGKRVDSIDISNFHGMMQKILLDKEIVPKVLVLKYISECLDGNEHNKSDYKLGYSIFGVAVLFSVLANKKTSDAFFGIVASNNWADQLNKWMYEFVSSAEITKGKLLAAYKYTEDDDFQRYRCKSFAAVCNYLRPVSDQNGYNVKVLSASALNAFLTDKVNYSIEHFIVSESGTLDIQTSKCQFKFTYSPTIKKYRNSLFNYIFIPESLNRQIGNGLLWEKLHLLQNNLENISCDYTKQFCNLLVSTPKEYFHSYPTHEDLEALPDEASIKQYLEDYFSTKFPNEMLDFATAHLRGIGFCESA